MIVVTKYVIRPYFERYYDTLRVLRVVTSVINKHEHRILRHAVARCYLHDLSGDLVVICAARLEWVSSYNIFRRTIVTITTIITATTDLCNKLIAVISKFVNLSKRWLFVKREILYTRYIFLFKVGIEEHARDVNHKFIAVFNVNDNRNLSRELLCESVVLISILESSRILILYFNL